MPQISHGHPYHAINAGHVQAKEAEPVDIMPASMARYYGSAGRRAGIGPDGVRLTRHNGCQLQAVEQSGYTFVFCHSVKRGP